MRAVVVNRFGPPSEICVTEAPEPTLGPGQALVEVKAAGCNFFDTLIVEGKYQEKPPFPFSPGGEVAGVVRELGAGVTGVQPGDRVFAYLGHGGYAERVAVSAGSLTPIPDGMSFEQAAGFPIVYGTAYAAVVLRGQTRPGETVVVTAAAGGVGLASVQVAKAVGARVVGLAGGDKLEVVRKAGADVALDYRADGWVDALVQATGDAGAGVVIDNVGGDVFDGCTKCIGWGGRIVVVGFASGKIPEIRLNRVLLKHISIVGLHFGPMRKREPETVREAYRALAELFAQGKIAPLVSRTFPLEQAAEALHLLAGRQSVGKIVLTV